MRNFSKILLTLFLILGILFGVRSFFPDALAAAPSVGAPVVSPAVVPVGLAVSLLVTSRITSDPSNPVIVTGVNLLRVDAVNKVIATLGTMRDNGTQGDAVAGDGTFTLMLNVNEAAAGEVRLRVSAAFKGLLKRVLSNVTEVPVQYAGPLTVPPQTPILDAVQNLDTQDPLIEGEISEDADGRRIVRTIVEFVFHSTITAGDVNRVLNTYHAVPTSAVGGTRSIVVRIPDPGTLSALDALVEQMESDPAVWFVEKAIFPATNELPPNYTPDAAVLVGIGHHLAVRAHGGWVARDRVEASPNTVVMDYFGNGKPNFDLDASLVAADFATTTPHEHGYHVLGIIAGTFGGSGDRGLVTGMMPKPISLRVVDLRGGNPRDSENRLLSKIQEVLATVTGKVVVNTSLAYSVCTPGLAPDCIAPVRIRQVAVKWIEKVRAAGLEERVLHVTTAGNSDFAGNPIMNAATNSQYTAAALRSDLVVETVDGTTGAPVIVPVPPLNNTLVIENDAATDGASGLYRPKCLSVISFIGGHLGAIGTEVWSFTDANSSAGYKSGTSMAAPQVAGLAAYLWALKPELTVQEVKAILLTTAQPVPVSSETGCSPHNDPAPIIDAYAAVLALDRHEALTGTDLSLARIRGTILDITDGAGNTGSDSQFTEKDLTLWNQHLITDTPPLDYSRYDLNADGYTGGLETKPFDLDIDNPIPIYSAVTQDIEGTLVSFDENNLTDKQVLCYYAYSPLYTGDTVARTDSMGSLCQPGPTILAGHLTFNSHSGVPGVSLDTVLSIVVTAEVSPQEGVIELRTVTGTGSETYTYASDKVFNCSLGGTASGRPPETKSGTVIGGSGLGILDGDPLGQTYIRPTVSGTETSTSCSDGVWTTSTKPGSFSSTFIGMPIVSNGSTIAIDFNSDFTDSYGERTITTGRLERGL